MSDDKMVAHARKLRADLNNELPNGVGNTIDALCDRLSERASMEGEIEMLRKALTEIEKHGFGAALDWSEKECAEYWAKLALKYRRIARAALTSSKTGDE